MIVEGQKVKVKWIAKNRDHYENKGYIFTKWYDEFEVKVEDLSEGASVGVMFSCDNSNCDEVFSRKYCNYIKGNRYSFCSKKCAQNPDKRIIHTKESLIEDFWRYYLEFKKYPLSTDFRFNKSYPDLNVLGRRFGSWDNYLKEVGVVDKDTTDGWYIHDEAILRKYYPDNMMCEITSKIMVKRIEATIRAKANSMGLKIKKEIKYILKYQNEDIKQKLINEAIIFFNTFKRTPYLFELCSVDNPKNAVNQNWDSYNDFLLNCNLPIFRRNVKLTNKEDGIIFLKELRDVLGRTPFISDADKYGVNKGWFTRIFGSYRNALFESGLIGIEDLNEQIKLDNSIEGFKSLYKMLDRVPTFTDYKEFATKNNLFHPNTLINKMNLNTYVEMCLKVFGEANWNEYDKDELIKQLIELKNKLGRPPMGKELTQNGLYSFYIYKDVFNKRYFNDIIRDLGWEPSGHDSYFKSNDELLDDYLNLFNELGRVPLRDDIDEHEGLCHSATYISRFENLSNVCDLLDLNYNELIADSQMGTGTSCFDNNGEICRSISEMKLTNILIKHNVKYIKEYPYKNITNNDFDRRRFDWYLPDLNVYIEYFGLFNKSQIKKDNYAGIYTRKTLKKIKDCNSLNIILVDLYPKDNKNKFVNFELTLINLKSLNTKINVI